MMSRRIEKQNVHGTGAPFGFSSTQCDTTDCVVLSNACDAKFSQYSTTDWFSNSYGEVTDQRSVSMEGENGNKSKRGSGSWSTPAWRGKKMRPQT